jgi:hypothetical protein
LWYPCHEKTTITAAHSLFYLFLPSNVNNNHREADLEREQKALEDARAQILAHELDANSREIGLRDQEARLAALERQLAERQMQELAIAQKRLENLQASRARDGQRV